MAEERIDILFAVILAISKRRRLFELSILYFRSFFVTIDATIDVNEHHFF